MFLLKNIKQLVKRTLCSLFLFWGLSLSVSAQVLNIEYVNKVQDTLKPLGKIILDLRNPETERLLAHQQYYSVLKRFLLKPGAEAFQLDSVINLAQLTPEDKAFYLYNWEFAHNDGTFSYYAFILQKNIKKSSYKLTELKDASISIKSPENTVLGPDKWFGAHYYKIIQVKYKRKIYYCLLGADWNDRITKKKLIEVMFFDKDGSIKFGAPIITYKKTTLNRLIFEYSSKVSMTLNYDEKRKLVIFDHLSPAEEELKGQYQFYTPDLSYDALKFRRGKWHYIENIDARNKK